MRKKGFLLGDVGVKLLIAVLAILVLIILGVKLFTIFSKENNIRKAEDNLNLIAEKISYLIGDYTKDYLYVQVFPPEKTGWFMRSFEEGFFPEKQCIGKFESCLCICKGFGCNDLKACKGFKEEVEVDAIYSKEEEKPGVGAMPPRTKTINYENTLKFMESVEELKIFKTDRIKISKSDRQNAR